MKFEYTCIKEDCIQLNLPCQQAPLVEQTTSHLLAYTVNRKGFQSAAGAVITVLSRENMAIVLTIDV